MKAKKIITYIKNGEEIQKKYNIITKSLIRNTVFKELSTDENKDEIYSIDDEIEYLCLKNIEFNRNVQFLIPNNTILILEDCSFKNKIKIIGGTVSILNPTFNTNLTNTITFSNICDLSIAEENEKLEFTNGKGVISIFSTEKINKMNGIEVETEKIYLNNIHQPQKLKLKGKNILLKDCNLDIEYEQAIQSNNLNIEKSIIYCQNDFGEAILSSDNISIKESKIYFNGHYFSTGVIKSNDLELINSILDSIDNLKIDCPIIRMDNESKLQSGKNIILRSDIYTKNEETDTELILQNLKITESKRNLISVLKALKKDITNEPVLEKENNAKRKIKKYKKV